MGMGNIEIISKALFEEENVKFKELAVRMGRKIIEFAGRKENLGKNEFEVQIGGWVGCFSM